MGRKTESHSKSPESKQRRMYISEENTLSITQESLVYEVFENAEFLFFELGKTSIY